ncbi:MULTISPECIES: hypothetical protein [unclassified Burkholderia]|uniref:hypothetical protein n=1 Tax=unclassified Burkholderia TaxID=2613784 RepID=UPI000F5A4658|nr:MULTISPECIES: hypothetical protein [unclassified Burkholderia]RQR33722.1 hypothetical protein DIE20_29820 [Burkholderia sp. Bp9131]RQR65782.1 hypothetical protein DIE12_31650 [Burkholderia sp. Bp9015]RQR92876.1 hypothetical protein DIE04_22555 [Burkholderia sp. Bp8994]RQS20874.1 hypothetical protein DIE05_32495 [Burkholderia sp. Bp8995]RQS37594.1 hypothetical protein DIE01_22480 [Burkholderia sp. Bp8990]
MPSVTIFIPGTSMPSSAALDALSSACETLCTEVLSAAPGTIHVAYVPIRLGRGHPVSAEIRFRIASFRTTELMDRFMAELDREILRHTGFIARIRCFGYDTTHLHARH